MYSQTLKNKFFIKRNDTLPTLEIVVVDRECLGAKVPFNLSGVTACTFSMSSQQGDMKIMAKTANIISATGGTISYSWDEEDTNESGMYNGEFQLMFDNGGRMSIPQIGSIAIEIGKDVNNY